MCPPNPSAIRKKMALLETLHEPEADDVFIERSHAVEIIDTQGDLPQPPDARRSCGLTHVRQIQYPLIR